jgi:hypothetical protein
LLFGVLACSKKSTEPSNNPPQILSWSADPNSGTAPLNVNFSYVVQDKDNQTLTCEIDVNNDGTPEKSISPCSSGSYQYTYNNPGTYKAKLKVKDPDGASDSSIITISVYQQQNNPPQILSWSANPTMGCSPLDVSYSWAIQDPDNDNMVCEIDADGDGTPETTIPNCTSQNNGYSFTFNSGGSYTSRLIVKDSKGDSAYKDLSIAVCDVINIVDQDVNVGPSSSYEIQFYAYTGDTLIFSAWVVSGNDISYLKVTDGSTTLYYNQAFTGVYNQKVRIPYPNTWKIILGNTAVWNSKTYHITAYLHRWP